MGRKHKAEEALEGAEESGELPETELPDPVEDSGEALQTEQVQEVYSANADIDRYVRNAMRIK